MDKQQKTRVVNVVDMLIRELGHADTEVVSIRIIKRDDDSYIKVNEESAVQLRQLNIRR